MIHRCTNILHDAKAEDDARAKVTSSGMKEGRIVHKRRSLSMSSVMQRRMKDSSTPQ